MHGTASPTHVGKPYHVTRVPSKPMLLLMRLISQTLRTEPSIDPTRLVLVGASSAWVGKEARYGLGASAAQAADWPRPAEAPGRLRHDLV